MDINTAALFEITKSMFNYPWLEYRERTKKFRKAMAPIHLPLSCYQLPKEEYPQSPEFWRVHPSKPNAIPYCHSQKPELFVHWNTLHSQRQERESQVLWKEKNLSGYLKDCTQLQNLYPTISNLVLKSKEGPRPLDPTKDPLKWRRLKELTNILKSPREDDQRYAVQALGYLGINDKLVMEALWQVAQTGPKKVRDEAYRTLAILGCMDERVIQTFIKKLTRRNEAQKMETLIGLRVALNFWAAVPEDKRIRVGNEDQLVSVLQTLIEEPVSEASLEAALCLGFLRPHSEKTQEFLLQCLGQGPRIQMKVLRMLVKIMDVHSVAITRAILDQLDSSPILEDRFEATQMLQTIGLEQIQAQGLEELTFDLLKRKTYKEPFLAMRKAAAQTMEALKMKPMMISLMEEQLLSPDASARQNAVISLGALGVHNSQVFHLVLDMLNAETNKNVKKSIKDTLIIWASTEPWIHNKLKNQILMEEPEKMKVEPMRFQEEPEIPEKLDIEDFRKVKLSPLFIVKSLRKKEVPTFSYYFSKPRKKKPHPTGPLAAKNQGAAPELGETSS